MKGNLGAVKPVGIATVILPVTQRLPTIHTSDSVLLLPQALERLSPSLSEYDGLLPAEDTTVPRTP